MKDSMGRVILHIGPLGRGVRRPVQWLPTREVWVVYRWSTVDVICRWLPWKGMIPVARRSRFGPPCEFTYPDHWEQALGIKKRDVSTGPGGVVPALAWEGGLFKQYPAVGEFLAATTYEDGSARVPGYAWLSNRTVAYEVTLFDPDGCVKLPCLGRTWAEAFALAEAHLRAESAPWQEDSYLRDRKAGKKKK